MAGNFSFTGWTSQSAAPGSLASRKVAESATKVTYDLPSAVGPTSELGATKLYNTVGAGVPRVDPASVSGSIADLMQRVALENARLGSGTAPGVISRESLGIGALNTLAQNPATADILMADPAGLVDPTLGSRQGVSVAGSRPRNVAIQTSPYRTADVPGFLQSSIDDLNQNQSLKRALQSEWINRLFGMATSAAPGGNDVAANQAWATNRQNAWNTLMASSVQPGSSFSYSAPSAPSSVVVRGGGGSSNVPRNQAVNTVSNLSNQLQTLEKQRQNLALSPTPIASIYAGSDRQKLDNQIQDLRAQQSKAASIATLATRGWTPGMPSY
jgi:hypothetical protein